MKKPQFKFFLGFDVSKNTLDYCLLATTGKEPLWKGSIPNNSPSISAILSEFKKRFGQLGSLRCALEATGHHGDQLEEQLHESGVLYSKVNPALIKFFAASLNRRTKNDSVDAHTIAWFSRERDHRHSQPLTEQQKLLRGIIREMEALIDQRTAVINRKKSGPCARVQASLQQQDKFLLNEINKLEAEALELVQADANWFRQFNFLCSITGIAKRTALRVLAELAGKNFNSAKELAAYCGLTPRQHQSGTSINAPARLCKQGNRFLRTALYMPAHVARRFCKPIKDWADGLERRGLAKKAIIGAVMRKLTHIIFGVLKNNQSFNPNKIAIAQNSY